MELRTAAMHGDTLWSRLGKSGIAVIEDMGDPGKAHVFANNILQGGEVLAFFDTPHGLVALGAGTVGIIALDNDETAGASAVTNRMSAAPIRD